MSNSITSFDVLPPETPAKTPRRQKARNGGPQSRYDSAASGQTNRDHWQAADGLSANAANSPQVRARLRYRSRYETANNGYAKGLTVGRANDCIGTGPRLQLVLPESTQDPDFQREVATPADAARRIEQLWQDWSDLVGLVDDLHVMDRSETREGEAFALTVTNPDLPDGGVKLDVRVYEADQVATPNIDVFDPHAVDGIEMDARGNPVAYHFLKYHPGDTLTGVTGFAEFERVPANRVMHLFDRDRAGQARGIPALTPGLPLFNQLRRYTLASLGAAELAASIAGVITDDNMAEPGGDDAEEWEAMDKIPMPRDVLLTLPAGKKLTQVKSEQPAPSYREFKGEILTESGRSLNAPRNVSTGSSAEYNYSSGRLDHLPYQQSIKIRRDKFRRVVLNPLFKAWLEEAQAIPGFLPEGLPPVSLWRWQWRWDGFASIDPLKDASANEVKLSSGQTTLDDVCAEQGKDWEEVLEQQAREMRKRRELGLPDPMVKPAAANQTTQDEPVPAGGRGA